MKIPGAGELIPDIEEVDGSVKKKTSGSAGFMGRRGRKTGGGREVGGGPKVKTGSFAIRGRMRGEYRGEVGEKFGEVGL